MAASSQLRKSRLDPTPDLLSGWKAIAAYLGYTVKTAHRMEKRDGLPIIRPYGNERRKESVFASKQAIDLWLKGLWTQ